MDKLNIKVKQIVIALFLLLGLEVVNLLDMFYVSTNLDLFPSLFYFLEGYFNNTIYLGITVPAVGLLLTFLITQKGIKAARFGFVPILVFYFLIIYGLYRIGDVSFMLTTPLTSVPIVIFIGILGLLFYGTIPILRALPKNKESISKEPEKLSDKEFLPALILCLFTGVLGVHRFYAGKIGTGILMMLTLGGLGIWVLVDFIVLCIGSFRDIDGRIIKYQRTVIAPPSSETSIAEELEKFSALKDKGIISKEEFNKKKEELLN